MSQFQTDPPNLGIGEVLNFLQREWNEFTREKARWEEEKAEMQARIAFLEGQRQGDANIKRDLLRRIRMLELALKKLRAKNAGQDEPSVDSTSRAEQTKAMASQAKARKTQLNEGRTVLLQYLQELRYTDDMIKSQAKVAEQASVTWKSPQFKLEGDEPLSVNTSTSSSGSSDGHKGQDDSDDSDEEIGEEEATAALDALVAQSHGSERMPHDDDEEELLEDLDDMTRFAEDETLANQPLDIDIPAVPDTDEQTASGSDAWAQVDDSDQLEESFEKQFGKKGHKMLAKLTKGSKKNKRSGGAEGLKNLFGMDRDEEELGELAGLSVTDEPVDDMNDTVGTLKRKWKARYVLKSHLDQVNDLVILHQEESKKSCLLQVVTACSDGVVRYWRIPETKKHLLETLSPVVSFFGHDHPVLKIAASSQTQKIVTGDSSGRLIFWAMPSSDVVSGVPYNPALKLSESSKHSGKIVALSIHKDHNSKLLSLCENGLVCFWDMDSMEPFKTLNVQGTPTCASFLHATASHDFVVGFSLGKVAVFDDQGKEMASLHDTSEGEDEHVTVWTVDSHVDSETVIAGFSDKCIRFFSFGGDLKHEMVAHQDEVKCLSLDPNGNQIASGGNDRSIRLWNIDGKNCLYETTAHRRGKDGAVLTARWSPDQECFATGGAEGTVRIYFSV